MRKQAQTIAIEIWRTLGDELEKIKTMPIQHQTLTREEKRWNKILAF